ncbi:DUF429 domain-containing protein [Segnochrobactrum spirostomi]|uniref:DUF429 domain-containing protein n=1 Tax=Segnochrobactrum spirostomi TaxID=2608987 RepID=A0A6A7Y438_9HYPH|nr:DUF429 domain-containing protein [Segnochrobactrum spirostomi]MQT13147.1 DUF429 domain-containing protein [Segnochrobactrum spirostomi]
MSGLRPVVAGVDGCPGGWAVVLRDLERPAAAPVLLKAARFADVLALPEAPAIIAVDMPIGLPDRTAGVGGRAAERFVRPLLGARQSSVFSVPCRAAVMDSGDDYRLACTLARAYSDPPRAVAKQCFMIFPKIREVDDAMRPDLEARVYESHPELAFWRLNGERPMTLPKRVRQEGHAPGLAERRALLERMGFPPAFFEVRRPPGLGEDDRLDAAVLSLIAERILDGRAQSFPSDPPRDGRGLRMAIWA